MTQPHEPRRPEQPRRPRCTLRTPGHGISGNITEFRDAPALWVHGSLAPLDVDLLEEVPGNQSIRFLPELSLPHTVEDPVGIPIELYHHASIEIRRRVASGFTPIWYPRHEVLVVGHRSFEMSLLPVPECESRVAGRPSRGEQAEHSRSMINEFRLDLYRESFSEFVRHRDVERLSAPPLAMFGALMYVWALPDEVITHEHLEFRDALLAALTLLVDVHKRPNPES